MTLRKAARRLGIGDRQLRRAVRTGQIPTYRIGGWPRLRWSDVLAWVNAHRTYPGAVQRVPEERSLLDQDRDR